MFQWWLAATESSYATDDIKCDFTTQISHDVFISRLGIDWCPYWKLGVGQYRNIGDKSMWLNHDCLTTILTPFSKLVSACPLSWLCVSLGFSVSLHAAVYVSLRVLHGVRASQETGKDAGYWILTQAVSTWYRCPQQWVDFSLSSTLSSLSISRPSWRPRSRTCHGKWSEPTATREEWWEARGSSAPATEGWGLLHAIIHTWPSPSAWPAVSGLTCSNLTGF